MAAAPSYITASDARDHMGLQNYMRCFDDGNTNVMATVDASSPVQTAMRESLVMVTSFLPGLFSKYPPGTGATGMNGAPDAIPALLKTAQLQYFTLVAYRRKPEFVKLYAAEPGGSLEKSWLSFMERLQKAEQQIDANDTPSAVAGQQNIGGFSAVDGPRLTMSNPDGSSNMGDF